MRSKRIFGFICMLMVATSPYSQISPNDNYGCHYIKLDKTKESAFKFPFQSLIITDERPDTLKAGYYYPGTKDNGIQKVCFQGGMKNELTSFFSSCLQYNSNSGTAVLACVKKIWFGTYDTTDIKEDKLPLRTRKLMVKIELYLNDKFCFSPLYRFDSTFNMNEMPGKSPSFVLEVALIKCIRKLVSDDHTYQGKRCLSGQQIDSFNTAYKTFPVLREQEATKGVYMTFEQFKNNQPAHTEFDLKFHRQLDVVYIPGKERKDSIVRAWGVSDGKKMYIRMGNNYFTLLKSGNNYDFYGFDTFFNNKTFDGKTPLAVSLLKLTVAKSNRSKPFQLNMENGEIY